VSVTYGSPGHWVAQPLKQAVAVAVVVAAAGSSMAAEILSPTLSLSSAKKRGKINGL